ncbi:MobA/MobL family protein [Xanthomonas hortorum]|uniref:Plasmid mobilization protein n=1 Tax=Xanthomonas hortorum pv. pelargonii TaxID=453602 RepID=A0A6V7CE05_9XANT|nr:MobA/MobL family protein [Xanthomonas hortorum]MCE4356518.1 MobA/MobL family protein [Xanthomonas hortorum pv. pelargonii]MCM5525970.1 MobA/MobL family protein [Xanthomonas hortorum pv. pelargonii]MCM5537769.1 MobA/MobL family protein [Xanthomonas hortorum pv. pelargonii]MCM5541910.1 MobA/MobL family protein [Xanthomonas hortorum pv. pelargonii]MCM5546706.1 MobA/MobL family protein [Xanthomonas hortorum pv. pelargonii]
MAIYHATMKSFSRGNGDSSVAAAAYRAGFDLLDTSTGLGHNYSHRGGVDFHQMLAPKGAPEWCFDAQYFWNANEAAETRKNARVCREVEVSLPHQLDPQQRRVLALALGQLLVNRFKVAVLVAVHTPSKYGDQRNHHVHLLMSARQVGPGGLGQRACAEFDARQGGGTRALRQIRKDIAMVINAHLKNASDPARVDHRSLRAQAHEAARNGEFERARELTRRPGKHLGKAKVAVMRKTKFTAEVRGRGGQAAALSLSKLVAEHMKKSGGLVHEVPPSHSHAAALRDRANAQASGLDGRTAVGQIRLSGAERVRQIKERLARAPAPRPGLYTPYSGQTRHLGRVTRLARSSGRQDAELLNAEAQLIEDWLEAQREVAQQSLEVLRQIPGIQIEPEFQRAHSTLVCRRADSYATKPFFFEDTEMLARSISKYAHALVRPYKARVAVLDAQAKLYEQEYDPDTKVVARAQRRLARTKRHVSPRIQAIQQGRIKRARKAMVEAAEALEKNFSLQPIEVLTPEASGEDALPPQAEGEAGHWELKFRPPKPSL